jgi:hypothetical protein
MAQFQRYVRGVVVEVRDGFRALGRTKGKARDRRRRCGGGAGRYWLKISVSWCADGSSAESLTR